MKGKSNGGKRMDDSMIVELYWQRDPSALTETKTKYGAFCRAVAYNILRSDEDAEECENDTYLAAWRAIPPSRPEKLRPFLGRITRNIAVKRLDQKTADKRGGGQAPTLFDELSECLPDGDGLESVIEMRELADALNSFLRSLRENERKMFVLRYWYSFSIAEIAKKCACGESKVKMSLKRTRDKLKKYLYQSGVIV